MLSNTASWYIMMKRKKRILKIQLSRKPTPKVRRQKWPPMLPFLLVTSCTKQSVSIFSGLARTERAGEQLDHQELVHKVKKGWLIYTKTDIRMHLEITASRSGIRCTHQNALVRAELSLYCMHLYLMQLCSPVSVGQGN